MSENSAPYQTPDHYRNVKTLILHQFIILLCVIIEQGCISCGTCSYPELTEDHVLTSAYVKIFRIVTRNPVNKTV